MILSRQALQFSTPKVGSTACLLCQWRSFSTSYRHLAEKDTTSTPTPKEASNLAVTEPAQIPSPLEDAPRSYGKPVDTFTPKPLSRPIGLAAPPRPGDNAGIDKRTWKQRRDDFVDYDKHLIRRKELTHKISTPYFREWSNMRLHQGKSFIAPPRIFRADRALFFPNFQGQTLVKDKTPKDTTPVLENKVSVVCVFSSAWAENQVASFTSKKANPELLEVIKSSGGLAQMVNINVEEDWLKFMVIKLFMGSLRKRLGVDNWGKYFVVRRGITTDIREAVGLLNSKVGYVYLLDEECRIRWAGSGVAEGDENPGLVRGAKRLIEDLKTKQKYKITPPAPLVGKLVGKAKAGAFAA